MAATREFERINMLLLNKQHLLQSSKTNNIVETVEDILGLHSTSPTTPYLSLLARCREFHKEGLERELYMRKRLGRIRCMRKTVFVLTKLLIPLAFAATRGTSEIASRQFAKYLGISESQYEKTARVILVLLKRQGMTTSEVKKALGGRLNVSAILNLMCDKGLLIRGETEKGWRSNLYRYHRFDQYFPDINLDAYSQDEARAMLVERYIASYGPTTENDICWWTGFPRSEVRSVLRSLEGELASWKIAGLGSTHFATSSDACLLDSRNLQGAGTINMLPYLDPYVMGYKDRRRYVPTKHWNNIFDFAGNATSTILVDGSIMGIWDYAEDPEPTIKLLFFEKVKGGLLDRIHCEAFRTGHFIADREVKVKECARMVPLTERTAGGVMTPLKETTKRRGNPGEGR